MAAFFYVQYFYLIIFFLTRQIPDCAALLPELIWICLSSCTEKISMKRDYWLYPESNLIVEKYYGVVNKEDFDRFDGSLFRQVKGDSNVVFSVADISEASFFNIKYDDLQHLFDAIVKRVGHDATAKIAFYNGNNAKDDYLKVSQFTKFHANNLEIESFVDLLDVMNWLDLNHDDRENLRKKLLQIT